MAMTAEIPATKKKEKSRAKACISFFPLLKRLSEILETIEYPNRPQNSNLFDSLPKRFSGHVGLTIEELVEFQAEVEFVSRLSGTLIFKTNQDFCILSPDYKHIIFASKSFEHKNPFVDKHLNFPGQDHGFWAYADPATESSTKFYQYKINTSFCSDNKGITVVELRDTTIQYCQDQLKSIALTALDKDSILDLTTINGLLQNISGSSKIDFGLIPVLKINDEIVFDQASSPNSRLARAASENIELRQMYLKMAHEYLEAPTTLLLNLWEETSNLDFIQILKRDGVRNYMLIPINNQRETIGMLEASSVFNDEIGLPLVSRLEDIFPVLAKIIEVVKSRFYDKIEHIVNDRFTALQPSVQWKFQEVAWKLSNLMTASDKQRPKVFFADLFALYGATDVRNSTRERNQALQLDVQIQVDTLCPILTDIENQLGLKLAGKLHQKIKSISIEIAESASNQNELRLTDLLTFEVNPLLKYASGHFFGINKNLCQEINAYLNMANEASGLAFKNRRHLEDSMRVINENIEVHLEKLRRDISTLHPCYFEKFRSDGIEYDIYLGQSMAPNTLFPEFLLSNARLSQLECMALIGRQTHNLVSGLDGPLLVTQLIFVLSGTLDIYFREDERRFDVEGAYNLRYQIIKKRIDKVHLKNSDERLTQPGKIAIVYSHHKVVSEYEGYIEHLQSKHLLAGDIEYLDLEDLQGVSGLRALRVSVNLSR